MSCGQLREHSSTIRIEVKEGASVAGANQTAACSEVPSGHPSSPSPPPGTCARARLTAYPPPLSHHLPLLLLPFWPYPPPCLPPSCLLPIPPLQVLLKLIQPYTRVRLPFISHALHIPEGDVERLLVSLILDNRIEGYVDQVGGALEGGLLVKECVCASKEECMGVACCACVWHGSPLQTM